MYEKTVRYQLGYQDNVEACLFFRRIEMITSYGNDTLSDSESDTEKTKAPTQAKKIKLSTDHQDAKKTKKNVKSSEVMFGPQLPQMDYNLCLPPAQNTESEVIWYSEFF